MTATSPSPDVTTRQTMADGIHLTEKYQVMPRMPPEQFESLKADIAAEQGHEGACIYRDRVMAVLTPAEVNAAQKAALTWRRRTH